MKKLSTLIALTGLALAFTAPVSFAQNAAPSVVLADHSMSTSKLIGAPVYNEQGQKIGSIVDVLVRGTASEPTAVLSVGEYVGGGSKLVAVPLDHVALTSNRATMAGATKQVLASMPAYSFAGGAGGAG